MSLNRQRPGSRPAVDRHRQSDRQPPTGEPRLPSGNHTGNHRGSPDAAPALDDTGDGYLPEPLPLAAGPASPSALLEGGDHTNGEARPGQLMTAEDLAARWQLPKSLVYRLTREAVLPTVKLGRYYRYRLDQVEAFERGGGGAADD